MKILIAALLLFIVGCSQPPEPCPNCVCNYPECDTTEKIVTEYVNVTTPCVNATIAPTNTSYILGLIRQIKHCEARESEYLNISTCEDTIENYELDLDECEDEVDDSEEEVDALEVELDECEAELDNCNCT